MAELCPAFGIRVTRLAQESNSRWRRERRAGDKGGLSPGGEAASAMPARDRQRG